MIQIDDVIRLVGTVLIFLSAVLATAFPIVYHITALWQRSEVGRHIMLTGVTLAVVIDIWTLALIFGSQNEWFGLLRLIAFAGVPYFLGRQIWLLLETQREGRRNRKKESRNDNT